MKRYERKIYQYHLWQNLQNKWNVRYYRTVAMQISVWNDYLHNGIGNAELKFNRPFCQNEEAIFLSLHYVNYVILKCSLWFNLMWKEDKSIRQVKQFIFSFCWDYNHLVRHRRTIYDNNLPLWQINKDTAILQIHQSFSFVMLAYTLKTFQTH